MLCKVLTGLAGEFGQTVLSDWQEMNAGHFGLQCGSLTGLHNRYSGKFDLSICENITVLPDYLICLDSLTFDWSSLGSLGGLLIRQDGKLGQCV